jgi:hypothetical protein
VERIVGRLSGVMSFARQQAGAVPRNLRSMLTTRADDPERVRAARSRLVETGCKEDLVRKFSAMQVILLDEKHTYEVGRDERLKLLSLAPWQIDALARSQKPESGEDGLFADLLPDVVGIRRALGRLEERVALLRHVEALRLYAAAHDGTLPAKLADVAVPLPDDPFTGRPFVYQVEAATAHLRSGPPLGEVQVTIQK